MICAICSKTYEKDRRKGHKGEICGSCRVAKARRARKAKAVEYKGGSCERCGYCKSNAALTFHHRNPEEKSFGIAENGKVRAWALLQAELDKCFSTIFSNLKYEQSNAVFNFFKHILSKVLTAKNSSLYAYMHHWREIPKTEEEKQTVKLKLIEEITTLLCQEFEKFEKHGVPSYFSYHQLLQIYVDNRKIQNLETKLPELEGLFQ